MQMGVGYWKRLKWDPHDTGPAEFFFTAACSHRDFTAKRWVSLLCCPKCTKIKTTHNSWKAHIFHQNCGLTSCLVQKPPISVRQGCDVNGSSLTKRAFANTSEPPIRCWAAIHSLWLDLVIILFALDLYLIPLTSPRPCFQPVVCYLYRRHVECTHAVLHSSATTQSLLWVVAYGIMVGLSFLHLLLQAHTYIGEVSIFCTV